MFKALFIGILGILMYRIIVPPKKVEAPPKKEDPLDFTDYEEIE